MKNKFSMIITLLTIAMLAVAVIMLLGNYLVIE